jgi:hypothetical protein
MAAILDQALRYSKLVCIVRELARSFDDGDYASLNFLEASVGLLRPGRNGTYSVNDEDENAKTYHGRR